MPGPTAWLQQLFTFAITNATLVTTAETVVATLSGIVSRSPGSPITLQGQAVVTLGTSATACQMSIRQDSLTGTLVGTGITVQGTAGNNIFLAFDAQDTSSVEYAGKTYVLTLKQVAATANGTVTMSFLQATG